MSVRTTPGFTAFTVTFVSSQQHQQPLITAGKHFQDQTFRQYDVTTYHIIKTICDMEPRLTGWSPGKAGFYLASSRRRSLEDKWRRFLMGCTYPSCHPTIQCSLALKEGGGGGTTQSSTQQLSVMGCFQALDTTFFTVLSTMDL